MGKITIVGAGYVGLSLAVLLGQHHQVTAVTTTPAKAEMINGRKSPIQDKELEDYLANLTGEKLANLLDHPETEC